MKNKITNQSMIKIDHKSKSSSLRKNWLLNNRVPKLVQLLKVKEDIDLDPIEVLDLFSNSDPSINNSATQWLIETYLKQGFRWEDIKDGKKSKVFNTLVDFNRFKKHLNSDKRSLYNYKTLATHLLISIGLKNI